jgi:hypothetical protein
MGVRKGLVFAVALVGLLVLVPAAPASYHLMKIREVHEGGAAAADFVELQMYSPGQNFVSGHSVVTYDGAGNPFQTFTFPGSASSGQNQRTILLAGQGTIGVTPDFVAPTANLIPGPSASVCFIDSLPSNGIDCVSFGSAAPPTTNPSPVGPPALPGAGLTDGMSLERSIARGCATLLEADDDTNDSAADFAAATPSPRPNSQAPTETECGGGGGGGDNAAPQTTITKAPQGEIQKDSAKFKFRSNEGGSTFECKLDGKPFKRCSSPRTYKNLDEGKHKFQVRATDAAGNTDGTPAKAKFRVNTA